MAPAERARHATHTSIVQTLRQISLADKEAALRLEDLLGRHVRYKGEEGHVVEGHVGEGRSGDESSVVVSIRGAHQVPRRNVVVPESEWDQLELLP